MAIEGKSSLGCLSANDCPPAVCANSSLQRKWRISRDLLGAVDSDAVNFL